MKRKIVFIGVLLVVITVLATSVFWYSVSSGVFSGAKYLVQVRYRGIINSVGHISVVFLQGNKTVESCVVNGDGTWYNVTLRTGVYIVKAYNADSGQYLNKYEINVAKDIQFEVSP